MTAFNFQGIPAPLSVLALLGAAGVVAILFACASLAALAGRRRPALRLAALGAAVPAVYAVALASAGLLSRERTVPAGGEKAFCEIDCHLAYAVVGGRREAGSGGRELRVVSLRTRFDETTISSARGNGPLHPNPRRAALADATGRLVATADAKADAALAKPLRPGESYVTDLVFDVPAGTRGLRLLLVESDWPTRLLIGHENGPLHAKTWFALPS